MSDTAILTVAGEDANAAFAAAWLRWRGERLLPRRRDLDLPSIRRLLPRLLLLEVISPEEARVRVAGTRIHDYLGFEITGANYIELAPAERRAVRAHRTWHSATHPCGTWLIYSHTFASGRVTRFEVLSLPLDLDQPSGGRLMLSHIAPISGYDRVLAAPATTDLVIGQPFRYVDIGAGIPASDTPHQPLAHVA